VDNLIRATVAEFGAADILVNNAGIQDDGVPLLELSEDTWDRVIDTNLKGYFLCCQAAGKAMVERKKGKIINIASIAGFVPPVVGGVYNISKAGVVMLTKVLARQLARYNIRVNAIAPGYVNTPMNEAVRRDPDRLRKVEAFIPLGHMAEPVDIAHAALFLASEASRHMTGHTMLLDGGQLLQYKYGVE
jgi:NAD(P)-dependent dehydrogenase (short-subunit alcohol dehydrogenase family)